MAQNKIIQIVLGAGRPFRGEQNASLTKVSSDARVLDWTIQAAKFLKPEVHFIAGYQIDEIVSRYPNLHYTINSKWSSTGPIISLLESRSDEDSEYIISYGDILFREKIVKELFDLESDIGIAIDSMWKERYSSRTLEDLNRSEKVIITDDELLDAGSDIPVDSANAEFIGLLRMKPEVMKYLHNNSESFLSDMRQANLSRLLKFLQINGFSIKVVDVGGDWAELNEANDLVNFILGTKAQSLKRLEEVITLSKIAPQVSFTVSDWINKPQEIINDIQTSFKSKKLIVRSSAISEDGFHSSNAGAYLSVLDINPKDKKAIIDSIKSVTDSYKDKNLANQVLVQPMIENVSVSGVIFTRTLSEGAPYYVINFDDSTQQTDTITSGSSGNHKTLIISRNNKVDLNKLLPKSLQGLIPAIEEIEQLLDFTSLDIEFAVGLDGEVHILQVRPLTSDHYQIDSDEIIFESIDRCIEKFRSLQNNYPFVVGKSAIFGVMPDWNPAEIIGTKPNSLSFDLYRYLITDEVWATQRAEYGYRDVRPHPLLVSFSGHPYIDVRASFNSFIPANLDEELAGRLVDFYQNRLCENPHFHDKVEFEIVPTCYAFNFDNWRSILEQGGFKDFEINNLKDGLRSITKNAILRTPEDLITLDIFKNRFDKIFYSNLPPLDKAITLLEDCRKYGTLVFAHLARSAFVSITLLKSGVESKVISQDAMDSFLNSIETVAHEFINDAKKVADNSLPWSVFINRYGHLRPGTYDITSEAYVENVERFLKPAVDQARVNVQEPYKKDSNWSNERESFSNALSSLNLIDDTQDIELFLRGAIEGREYAKFIFSRNLSAALDLIIEYGKIHGLNRKQLANISLGSLFALRAGNISTEDASIWLANESNLNKNAHKKTNRIELPPLLTSESDFSIFMYPSTQPNYVGSDRVLAEVVSLRSEDIDQDSSSLDQKILLIPQADPGFDWIFGHNIAGLITMYGGGNSHMAIRAEEFSLPAAIGVGEALYKSLSSASIIELDSVNRKIEVIR